MFFLHVVLAETLDAPFVRLAPAALKSFQHCGGWGGGLGYGWGSIIDRDSEGDMHFLRALFPKSATPRGTCPLNPL